MKQLNTYLHNQCLYWIIYRLLSFRLLRFCILGEVAFLMFGLSMIQQAKHKNYVTELIEQ